MTMLLENTGEDGYIPGGGGSCTLRNRTQLGKNNHNKNNQAPSLEQPEHRDDEDKEGQDEAGGDDQPGKPLVLRPLTLQVRRPGRLGFSDITTFGQL